MEDNNSNMRTRKEVPEKLKQRVLSMVGFNAVYELGCDLKAREIRDITRYCEYKGANKLEVEKVLRERGRPYDVADVSFSRRCMICNALRNYCCC